MFGNRYGNCPNRPVALNVLGHVTAGRARKPPMLEPTDEKQNGDKQQQQQQQQKTTTTTTTTTN
jgi:hypothetical protein